MRMCLKGLQLNTRRTSTNGWINRNNTITGGETKMMLTRKQYCFSAPFIYSIVRVSPNSLIFLVIVEDIAFKNSIITDRKSVV